MRVNKFNAALEREEQGALKPIRTRLTLTQSNTSMYNMSPSAKKQKPGALLPRTSQKSEMAIQTDVSANLKLEKQLSLKKVKMAETGTGTE